jgi:DNA-binding NtrC family response regulator
MVGPLQAVDRETVKEKQFRILVIDDESDICWALENILRNAGFSVASTTSGAVALELATRETYGAIFIDAKLPDMDGIELATLISRSSPQTALVLISAYYYPEDQTIVQELQKSLFIGFLPKPFNLEEVRLMAYVAQEGHDQ